MSSFPMFCNRRWGEKFGDKPSTPLELQRLEVHTVINADLPETSITTTLMTFHNSLDKTLEGALEVELPEDAVVCGFGLDLDQVLVDGVVVEKEKARIAFEEAVRSGQSAAMAEMVKGNIFKNRVYPLHPGKTRQVKVAYQSKATFSDSGDINHTIPVRFDGKLKELRISIECTQPKSEGAEPPMLQRTVKTQPSSGDLKLSQSGDRYVSNAVWTDVAPEESEEAFSFTISLPKASARPLVAIENDVEDKGNDAYFAISCMPHVHGKEGEGGEDAKSAGDLSHIVVYWDASLSREPSTEVSPQAKEDRESEVKLITAVINKALTKSKSVTLSVFPFRAELDHITSFTFTDGKDTKEVFGQFQTYINSIDYDGATNLSVLSFPKVLPQLPSQPVGCYLLVTDGMATLGSEKPPAVQAPVFTVNGSSKSNAPLLRFFAEISGALYLNRESLKSLDSAVDTIFKPSFQFIAADIESLDGKASPQLVCETFPSHSVSLSQDKSTKFTLVGKLKADAKITLLFGTNLVPTYRQTYTLKRESAVAGTGVVARAWAQSKMAELNSFPDMHKDAILDIGKRFSIVTANTSFVVLDTLEQHILHKVVPHASRKALHDQYVGRLKANTEAEESRRKSKLSVVQNYLRTRKSWYQRKFPDPPRWKFEKAPAQQPAKDGHRSLSPPAKLGLLDRVFRRKSAGAIPAAASSADDQMIQSHDIKDKKSSRRALADDDVLVNCSGSVSLEEAPLELEETASKRKAKQSAAPSRGGRPGGGPPPSRSAAPLAKKEAASSRLTSSRSESAKADKSEKMKESKAPAPKLAPDVKKEEAEKDGDRDDDDTGDESNEGDEADSEPQEEKKAARRDNAAGGGPNASGGDAPGGIKVKAWDPSTPYMKSIKSASNPKDAYKAYLSERKAYRSSPAFYFDVASHFFALKSDKDINILVLGKKYGISILTSVLELELESPQLLRIVGYKLAELYLGEMAASVFEKVQAMRSDEPQSHRDLALTLYENRLDFERALTLYDKVLMGQWDSRFSEIEVTALSEMNALISSAWGRPQYEAMKKAREEKKLPPIPDPSLIDPMPVDLRVVMGWDTDMTDVDLHVTDPSGEECYFSNKNTKIGGLLSRDFTQGYGPEEFNIKKAHPGKYHVQAKYFANHQQSLSGATTLLLYVYKYFGTPHEEKEVVALRLSSNKSLITVANVEFWPAQTLETLNDSMPIQVFTSLLCRGTFYNEGDIRYLLTRSGINAKTVGAVKKMNAKQLEEVYLPKDLHEKVAAWKDSAAAK